MRYEEELIDEVREKNDIVDVISSYVSLKKRGSNYVGLCPFHNEKSPSFSVSRDKQMYYCFGCGQGGNVYTFLMEYNRLSFVEALQNLAQRAGVELPEREQTAEERQQADARVTLRDMNKEAAVYFHYLLKSERGTQALSYLKNRGLSDETINHFGLGYADIYRDDLYQYLRSKGFTDYQMKESSLVNIDTVKGNYDKFFNRVIFPIMDMNQRVIGFGGRVMGDGEPKYLNSPETMIFDKSRNLYGLNFARTTKKHQILLCEGYMDVIALHQAGFDNAVAALGTAFTPGHANLLKRYTKEVYLTFDSDGAGIRAAKRAIPILKEAGITAKVINMKPYKDPDEFIKALGAEEYEKRIEQAENSFLFEIRLLSEEYDLKDPAGKTEFANETAKKLLQFSEELERDNYIEAIADKYGMGFENLRKLVYHFGTQGLTGSEPRQKKSREKPQKEDGMKQSQRLLLTWLIEDTRLFELIEEYLGAEDFTEDIYQKTAQILFEQYHRDGKVNPAQIINLFGEEDQSEIASLFHARIAKVETKADREKALKETILRVKQNSIREHSKHLDPTDMAGLQKIIADKKQLEKLEKTNISIP